MTPDPAEADAAARAALERAKEAARAKGLRRGGSRRRTPERTDADRPGGSAGGPGGAAADSASAPETTHWRPGPGLGDVGTGPRSSPFDPQPLGSLADWLLVERGWRRPVGVGGVVGRWREVVGDQIADHCAVETFDEGSLVLRTSSTAWATQVRLLLPQLERRLAEEVGEGTVTSIVILPPGGPSWKHGRRTVRGRGPRDTYG